MDFITSTLIQNDTLTDIFAHHGSHLARTTLPMTTFLPFVVVFTILFGALLKGKKLIKSYSGNDSVFPKKVTTGVPLVSMLTIFKCFYQFGTDFQKIFETLIESYGGIFKVNLMGYYNIVFIFNPSMVQKLCMSNEPGHLNKPKWYSKVLGGPLQDGLIAARSDTWKIHRGVISKAFTYKGLVRQLNIVQEHAEKFVLTLKETSLESTSINKPLFSFSKQVRMLTYDIINHIAAGNEIHTLSPEDKTRCQINQERLQEFVSYRIHHPLNYIDFIWNLNPKKWEMDRTLEDIDKYTNKIIEEIVNEFDANNEKDERAESLVELMAKAGFSNKEIFTEMTTILGAGHDTVSSTLYILTFLLASYKEYQDKCREEIDNMFEKISTSNSTEISMEMLNGLKFLDMCIKECLRLYPIIPLFGRHLETPIQLDEDTYLPSNTIVLTSPWVVHRNPKIYPEPEKFDPERFSPENVKNMRTCEFMSFSMGSRNCIGFKSATIELKVLVSYILYNFEVQSDMSIDDLNRALRKQILPFPDFGIKINPRL